MVDTPLQLPNFGNALLAGTHARYYGQEADLKRDEERRRQAVQPDIPAAMAGDNAAMGRVAAGDPKTALVITQALSRLDANKLAQVKAASEYTARAANAVLQADPSERASVYQQMHALGVHNGYDMSGLPQQYTPALDPILRGHRAQAVPILEWFKQQGDTPQPMGGGGTPGGGSAPAGWPGGAPATIAPDKMATGQNMVQGLVKQGVSPVAAASMVGSLYQESGFNPAAVGDGGTAYGMGQWRNDRAVALGQFAQQQGKPPTDPQVQVAFMMHEMQNGDQGARQAWALLQQAKTPEEGAAALMHFFRPQGYTPNNPTAGHGYQQRVQYAQALLPPVSGVPGAAPGVPGPIAASREPPPGVGTAPVAQMPGPPAGLIPPGPPPAQMPQVAPGAVAQGSGGDGSGTPVPPAQGLTRGIQLPPGARMMGIKGVPVVKDGNVLIVHPDGTQDWMPLPPRTPAKEPGNTAPAGPFAGNAIEAQYANILAAGAVDPAVRGTFAYAQAYAHAAAPHTTINANGVAETIQPDVSHIAKPTFTVGGGAPTAPAGPQPAAPTAQGAPAPDGPQPPLPLPGGQSVTVTPIPGAQAGKPMSSEQARDAGFSDRMLNSNKLLDTFAAQGANPGGRLNERIPFGVGNYRQTPEYQQFKQARDDFINAQLRRESGAAISEAEYARADSQYFPQPGDKPEVIKQKEVNRRLAVEAMVRGAGPTYKPNTAAEGARDQFDIGKIPQPARDRLKANPGERAQFDEIFGAGAADKVLGR